MIDAVVFDIGMVLVEWQPESFYQRHYGSEHTKKMFDACDLHAMNHLIDLGGHSRDVAYGHAEKHPEYAEEIRRWHDDWIDMLQPDIPGTAAILRAVKAKGLPVYALTNFGDNTLEVAKEHYPILKEFDGEIVSGRLKVCKPDARIYEAVEALAGVPSERLIFTDDNPANVSAAMDRGWKAHLFDRPEGWFDRLCVEGVLSPDDIDLAVLR